MHPYETLPMNVVGYILAAWLIGFHLWMIVKKKDAQDFAVKFPRNYIWGAVLMAIGMLWFWLLIVPGMSSNPIGYLEMDLGDFNKAKKILVLLVPVAAFFMITEVKEFLAVRATGLICFMVAAPILYCCWGIWPTGKLLLPIYAYVLIAAGCFLVGMPYLLRDGINWLIKDDKRWYGSAFAGLGYGVAVLICTILYWGAK